MKSILWPISIIILAVSIFLFSHLTPIRAYSGAQGGAMIMQGSQIFVLLDRTVWMMDLSQPSPKWGNWGAVPNN